MRCAEIRISRGAGFIIDPAQHNPRCHAGAVIRASRLEETGGRLKPAGRSGRLLLHDAKYAGRCRKLSDEINAPAIPMIIEMSPLSEVRSEVGEK